MSEDVEIVDLKSMTSRPLSMVSKDSEDITDNSDSGRPPSTLSGDKSSLLGTATGDNSLIESSSRPESSMTEKDSRRSSIFSSKDVPLSESIDGREKISRPPSGDSAKSSGAVEDSKLSAEKYMVKSEDMYANVEEENTDDETYNSDIKIDSPQEIRKELNPASPIFSLVSHQVQGLVPDYITPDLVKNMIPIFEPNKTKNNSP